MARLSESDFLGVLDVVGEAGAVEEWMPFPEPVLDALRRVVPCDVVAYHERVDRSGPRVVVYTGEPRGETTPEIREASRQYWHQDPLTQTDGARKYSDFFSRREFHRLELYQETARPIGVEYMMRLWVDAPGEGCAGLEFDRQTHDFTERDRSVLDLLLPHLRQFRWNAIRRRRLAEVPTPGGERLTPRQREVLELVAEGRQNAEVAAILGISPGTVRKHLENAYEKLDVHTRTGAVAALRTSRPGATPVFPGRSG